MMNQNFLSISLALLLPLFYSTSIIALAALSPATSPAAQPPPTPPAASPATPLVPTLPQPPTDNTPENPTIDIVGILRNAKSFNIFIRLMKTTQLINQLNSQLITIKSGGLTILAPEDSAFSQLKPGFLNSLSDAQKLELLQFHVLPDYVPASNFDTLTNPVRTLVGNKPGKVELNVISFGGSVNISTGEVNTTINGIIYTDKHLAIYKVGKVLIPSEFVATKKTIAAVPLLAPAPAVDAAKAPKADKEKPESLDDDSSNQSSQVVPTQTSAAAVSLRGMWVAIVLGGVFGAAFTI